VQPCRDNEDGVELPLLDEVPPAPPWMPNAHAVNEYERLAPILHANKLLTSAGVMALAHLCAIHGKMVQLWAAGECPTGHMLSQYRALINDFALTPVAQGRVKVGGTDAKKKNRFASNVRGK
jgi:hypothetical protein